MYVHHKCHVTVQNTRHFSWIPNTYLFSLHYTPVTPHIFFLSPSVPPSFSSTVFTPSCHCWRPPAGSDSSRGPATVMVIRPPTAREVKLWCRRRSSDKTIPWVCGGPDRSALPQRGARDRAQRWWRPETLLVQPADTNWVTPIVIFISGMLGMDKICHGSVRFSLQHEVEIDFWMIFEVWQSK